MAMGIVFKRRPSSVHHAILSSITTELSKEERCVCGARKLLLLRPEAEVGHGELSLAEIQRVNLVRFKTLATNLL